MRRILRKISIVLLVVLSLVLCACSQKTVDTGSTVSREVPQPTEVVQPTEAPQPTEAQQPTEAPQPTETPQSTEAPQDEDADAQIDPEQYYYDLESVVLYLETYGELPLNYITKDEAKKRGWEGGSVEDYYPDAAIGGDYFGNFEKKLPTGKGIKYTECDLDTHGYKNRGSRRLIYSNDGRYFYTRDHYETFKEVLITDNGIELVDY